MISIDKKSTDTFERTGFANILSEIISNKCLLKVSDTYPMLSCKPAVHAIWSIGDNSLKTSVATVTASAESQREIMQLL